FAVTAGHLALYRQSLRRLRPGGWVQVIDYGYRDFKGPRFQDYYFVSQVDRRLSGRVMNEVSFPLLAIEAGRLKCQARWLSQEKLLEAATGRPMIDPVLFVPAYAARKIIRHASVPGGIFDLKRLKHAARVFSLAKEFEKSPRSAKHFEDFIEAIGRQAAV